MPQTKEERKEKDRQYRLKNKEKAKQYRLNNKEKRKEYLKEYCKTEEYKKSNRITNWKYRGILCFNYSLLYDLFLSTKNCEYCNVELTTDRYHQSTTRCLDHDHNITDRFNVRGVLCHSCNVKDVLK